MGLFQRLTEKFTCKGLFVSGSPSSIPEGKFPFLLNVRAYLENAFVPRMGLTAVNTVPLGQTNVHSLTRLNDSSTVATNPAIRVTGAGTVLYGGVPSANPPPAIDTGYSGNPLTFAVATPPQSPRPFLYVGDSAKTGKTTTDGPVRSWGIAPPVLPPTAALQPPLVIVINDFATVDGWTAAGTVVTTPPQLPGSEPINTTISTILLDSLGEWALINLTSMVNVSIGERLTLSGTETVLIADVKIPVANTTVQAIAYDTGNTGYCSVVPVGSLGTGQITSELQAGGVATAVLRGGVEFTGYLPPEPQTFVEVTQPLNFPVDCLITIGGEAVRILSVQTGRNGTLSFRCYTNGTHAAGAAIDGLPAIRCYCALPHSAGDSATMTCLLERLTPTNVGTPMVGGMQNSAAGPWNLAQFPGGTAVLPADVLHLSLYVDFLSTVTEVRVYFDVNNGTTPFLTNYYMAVWSANDLVAALQTVNAGTVDTVLDIASTSASNSATASSTTALTAAQLSQQLASGDSQWIQLSCPISNLIRVGSDTTKTLANVGAIEVLVDASGANGTVIIVQLSSLYISGGGNVDIGTTGSPIVYWYRYRSQATGAVSNPSPPLLGGLLPRRQAVSLFGTAPTDPQVELIDWFRQGATLSTPTYDGSEYLGVAYADNFSDSELNGGEQLSFTNFQPWPTVGAPVTGTCTTVGSSVFWVSGGTFNTNWAPGGQIIINGLPYTFYAQPQSSTFLTINENALAQTNVNFYILNPTLLGQPLQCLFAGTVTGVLFMFAVGDPNNPGTAYWTNGNVSETTSDANTIQVTDASEPLLCGWWYDGVPYVLSSEQLYVLMPDFGNATPTTPFHPQLTPCGRGGWTPWAWVIAAGGVAFLGKDGIYFSAGPGALAQSLTDPDLRLLFPHDGGPGVSVTVGGYTIYPPDMTQTTLLRLSYVDGFFYFDFQDTSGAQATLALEWSMKRWFYDQYGVRIQVRDWEPGESVHDCVVGTSTGLLATMVGLTDLGAPIPGAYLTHTVDGGDPRTEKQWGDFAVNANVQAAAGVTATPYFTDDVTPLAAIALANTQEGTIICDLNAGAGQLSRTMALLVQWTNAVAGLITYWWTPTVVPKVEKIIDRATDWSNLGSPGAKWVQGILLRANTYGNNKVIQIQGDGGVVALTLTINHAGEETIAYPNAAAGWTPFTAHLVRLVGADTVPWQLYDSETVWVSEPAPELATEWAPQPTTCDLPGYFSARDFLVAHVSTADLTLTISYDGAVAATYTIPNSGGQYARTYLPALVAAKGRSFQPILTSTVAFQLFKRDCSMRVGPWGRSGGFISVMPFGGQSRSDGAAI